MHKSLSTTDPRRCPQQSWSAQIPSSTLLVERIDSRKGEEKKRAEALREIVIPLIIFQLHHQIVYVLSDEQDEKEEEIFY